MKLKRIIYVGFFICLFMMFMPNVRALEAGTRDYDYDPDMEYLYAHKGSGWEDLWTPQHYIKDTDPEQVAYCIEHQSPGVGGSYKTGTNLLTTDNNVIPTDNIKKGLRIILLNGYPYSKLGFTGDNDSRYARYATANAIRFWLAETRNRLYKGGNSPYDYTWMDFHKITTDKLNSVLGTSKKYILMFDDKITTSDKPDYDALVRNKSGHISVLKAAIKLLIMARQQNTGITPTYTLDFSSDSLKLDEVGANYVGYFKVTYSNLSGGYEFKKPSVVNISKDPINGEDAWMVKIPVNDSTRNKTFTIEAIGKDNRTADNMKAFASDNNKYQAIATIYKNSLIEAISKSMMVSTPMNKPDCDPVDPGPSPIKADSIIGQRELDCAGTPTTVGYNSPFYTIGYKQNDNNDASPYCTIKCSSSLSATFAKKPGDPNINAGRGFEYPVDFSGNRTCDFNFYMGTLRDDINKAVQKLSDKTRDQSKPNCRAWRKRYDRLVGGNGEVGVLNECRNMTVGDLTGGNAFDINMPPSSVKAVDHKNETVGYYQKTKTPPDIDLDPPTQGGVNINFCDGAATCENPASNWVSATTYQRQKAYLDTKFAINHVYVDIYSGKLSYSFAAGDKKYDGGDMYYTDFFQATYLNGSDYTKYNFDVTANFKTDAYTSWIIKDDCSYTVDNHIFPPNNDVHYPAWGNTAFMFRQISLTTPFPSGHVIGENWKGRESLIKANVYNQAPPFTPPYMVINLTPSLMHGIRNYNSSYSYTTFEMTGDKVNDVYLGYFIRKGPYKDIFHIAK